MASQKFEMHASSAFKESGNENSHCEQSESSRDIESRYASNCSVETCRLQNNQPAEIVPYCSRGSCMLRTISGLYAELLLVIASVSVFTELQNFVPLYHIHAYLFVYLLGMGIIFLIGGYGRKFSRRHHQQLLNSVETHEKSGPVKLAQNENHINIDVSFRILVVVFGFTALISSCLESISLFVAPDKCRSIWNSTVTVLHVLFTSLQMAFLVINPSEILAAFGCFRDVAVMHLTATNAALGIRMLLWESAKDWQGSLHFRHNASVEWFRNEMNVTVHSLESDPNSVNESLHYPRHAVHFTGNCWWRTSDSEVLEDILAVQVCLQHSVVGRLWERTADLLYPFITQYYFVIVCSLYIIWMELQSSHFKVSQCKARQGRSYGGICNRSTKGFCLGCIILIVSIVILLIYVAFENKNFNITIVSLYCTIFSLSICAAILGIIQIKNMIPREVSHDRKFMKLFLRVGLFMVYVYGTFKFISGCYSNSKLNFLLTLEAAFMIVHAAVQYVFIIEISKKKNDQAHSDEKPGRQAVIFLMMCNVSLWLLECFVTWSQVRSNLELNVYGISVWPVVTRVAIPFVVFYRFYSAIVLLKAWKMSYK